MGKIETYIGKPEVIREDWTFWFEGWPIDKNGNIVNVSKHRLRNRHNKYRYIKQKKDVK